MNLDVQLVTDERVPFECLCEVVDAAVGAGVDVVQLRAKSASVRKLIRQSRVLSELIAGRALFIVNDRLDVVVAALAEGIRVDGVHLGQDDAPPVTARRLLGADALIGWTADRAEHLAALELMPPATVSYLGVGAIRDTATKPDHPGVLGIDGFASFAARTSAPCVAIGGVGVDDVHVLRASGAAGVAVVSAICGAADPAQAAREFVEASR